jgi:hypothetical protein
VFVALNKLREEFEEKGEYVQSLSAPHKLRETRRPQETPDSDDHQELPQSVHRLVIPQ